MGEMKRIGHTWPELLYRTLKAAGVHQVGYVPDAGHKRLIELCLADKEMRAVVLSTEAEGMGLAAGAWLGGQRSALLMQSSGVGNCINQLGTVRECRFPLLMLVTMRGQKGEFNPWQVPMGQATPAVLQAMDVVVEEANTAEEIVPAVDAAARLAFGSYQAVAVLISQAVIGIKSFQDQASR
jgi:sulfopyruvate decarboxylase alpha subunit